MKKTAVSQELVNIFPAWSGTRSDEQSLGFQVHNVIAQAIEDIRLQLEKAARNYYLPTVNLNEIDQVHVCELPRNTELIPATNDSAEQDFITPTVSGKCGGTWHSVALAENNNIEGFWYRSVPTRLESTVTVSGEHQVLAPVNVSESPITSTDNPLHLEGRVHVTIASGIKFLSVDGDQVHRGMIQLAGITRKGTEESETMIFLYDNTLTTTKEWKTIDSVKVYNIDESDTKVSISSARFNDGPYQDFYNIFKAANDERVDTFWDLGVTVSGQQTLDLIRFSSDNFQHIVLAQLTGKEVIRSTELLDVNGLVITPVDLTIVPFHNRIWVCEANKIHLYDTDLYYPNMAQMTKKQNNAECVIQVDSYHKVLEDNLELNYIMHRVVKTPARHRVYVQRPDGSRFGIKDGIVVSYSSDLWQFGMATDRALRYEDIIPLQQRGDWIFTLEVLYEDGTTSIDQRIVSVESKNALTSIDLPISDAVGIDIDSDQHLWILDSSGIKHRIDLKTDVMLIDYEKKTLFFHTEYDEVQVVI
jgi:hypothetical protein